LKFGFGILNDGQGCIPEKASQMLFLRVRLKDKCRKAGFLVALQPFITCEEAVLVDN
jgi:hypothetical protein